jgi:sulfur-oxidizing protein SoxZ
VVPVHILDKVACRYGGREVFSAQLGTGMSANPYMTFFVRAGESGELAVEWSDDRGETGRAAAMVNVV